ncbi:SA1362 family protein [Ornithinibacillus bavariensis]|uniref:Uncharacterized protein n=1 Tax=Ornithinibacillus bavariensis TaxID=545502 RepID=A0A919XAQ1_9BACI|nr:SA1362 family protein [Ornithinibacillus bavariensis]GIO27487.1 hypothetical protein J43TS3_20980 [Ornithinibacillus bavariensis]
MRKGKASFIIYGLIILAAIGIVWNLVTNPAGFLTNILMMVIMGLVLFGILYFVVFGRRGSSSEEKKYKQAVRQSKSKYTQNRNTVQTYQNQQPSTIKKKNKKRPNHLRVIDGNKAKRKKRASN